MDSGEHHSRTGSSLKIIGTGEKAQMIAGNIISAEKNQGNQYSGSLEISNILFFMCEYESQQKRIIDDRCRQD